MNQCKGKPLKKRKSDRSPLEELCRKAEEKAKFENPLTAGNSSSETQKLIYELQVHQIELEMQNEELRQAQGLLEESRSRYIDLYDFAPLGYLTLDGHGIIQEVNYTAACLVQVESAQLIGWHFNNFIVPEDLGAFLGHLNLVLNLRGRQTIELRLKRKDKQEVFISLESTFYQDTAKRSLVRTAFTDITERRQAEEALERLRLQNELILKSAGEGIFQLNLSGEVTFANPAAANLTGYQAGEMHHRLIQELIHYQKADGSPYPLEECPMHRTLMDGESRRVFDDVFWTKEGEPLPVEYVTTPINEDGRPAGAVVIFRGIAERKRWEGELRKANEQLQKLVARGDERNHQMMLLQEMGDVFQVCQSSPEAYGVIAEFAPQFFADYSGALYILNNAINFFEMAGSWGENPPPEVIFGFDECWALRRSKAHSFNSAAAGLRCQHVSLPVTSLCIPLMAQGEAMGVLHLQSPRPIPAEQLAAARQLGTSVAEGMALALANQRLREIMRHQAIRDSLTGLYNRRYLEETLEREVHRGNRLGICIGIIMMDLDQFKAYNDNYGHTAGDEMLRAAGQLIQNQVRGEDIACRYGGEEFLVIMPGASLEVVQLRAETIVREVKQLHLQNHALHPITISAGVAIFPDDGATADLVVQTADQALYRAKAAGRDRVMVAGSAVYPGSAAK